MKTVCLIQKKRRAISMLEYGLIAGLIAIATLIATQLMGGNIQYQYCIISAKIGTNGSAITTQNSSCIKSAWLDKYGFSSTATEESDQEIVEKCNNNSQCYAQYQSIRFNGNNLGILDNLGASYNEEDLPYNTSDAKSIAQSTCQKDYGDSIAESGCEATISSALSYQENEWYPNLS